MGAQTSEELVAWASASDVALIIPRMRVIPALPVECQVEAVRRLWRSLRWVPQGVRLLDPNDISDRVFIIVQGEAEAVLGSSKYIPILPAGSFFCEAALLQRGEIMHHLGATEERTDKMWPFQRWRRLPASVLAMIGVFLKNRRNNHRFRGRVRTTQRSLVATLTRQELLKILKVQGCSDAMHVLNNMPALCNALWNVTTFSAEARALSAQDMVALRVVCEGPLHTSCQASVIPAIRSVPRGMFGECMDRPQL